MHPATTARSRTGITTILLLATALLLSAPAGAVTPGQVDDFEDGTTQNWTVGSPHPEPPVNVPTGGPDGADDNYLLATASGGNGPGSRLAVRNGIQWAGDYLAAGVASLELDLLNLGNVDLDIRLLFEDTSTGSPTHVAVTSWAAHLPAGSGWTAVSFPIAPADLIPLLGSVEGALENATGLRIFHNPDAGFPPPPVVAQLGIDNIRAPEGPTPVEDSSWGRVKSLFRQRDAGR